MLYTLFLFSSGYITTRKSVIEKSIEEAPTNGNIQQNRPLVFSLIPDKNAWHSFLSGYFVAFFWRLRPAPAGTPWDGNAPDIPCINVRRSGVTPDIFDTVFLCESNAQSFLIRASSGGVFVPVHRPAFSILHSRDIHCIVCSRCVFLRICGA